ncbi:MAG: hypothetical protein R3E97_20580 [Candidatus Eisenbacteria bacterium]
MSAPSASIRAAASDADTLRAAVDSLGAAAGASGAAADSLGAAAVDSLAAAEAPSAAERGPDADVREIDDTSIFRFLRNSRDLAPPPEGAPGDDPGGRGPAHRDSLETRSEQEVALPDSSGLVDPSWRAGGFGAADGDSAWAGADSLGGVLDSLAALASAEAAHLRPEPLFQWGPTWADRSVDRAPREIFEWISPLRTVESGNPFMPDPLDWGDLPGREPVAYVLGGIPANPPGMPEAVEDPFAPSFVSSVSIRRPNPLRLPNNPTGGALVEAEWAVPDSAYAVSAARLSDGSAISNSDEFMFVRPGQGSLFRLFWSDHKTAGRQGYRGGKGSQVWLGYEFRALGGKFSLWSQNQFAKQRLNDALGFPSRRWLWNRDAYSASYSRRVREWALSLDYAASWHRFAWEDSRPAQRKDGVQQAILRGVGPGESWWPLATLQVDRHQLRYWEPGRASIERTDVGLGLAVGMGGVTESGRYELSVGRSDPGTESAGLVYGAEADWSVSGWNLQGYAGRTRRARLVPRLANHLYLQVAQGIALSEIDETPEAEVLDSAELWGGRSLGASSVRFGLRATQITGAISAEAVGLLRLTPTGLLEGPLPEEAVDQTVSVIALHSEWLQPLRFGFDVSLDGAVRTSSPGREAQLWMTPAELRAQLHWRALLFSEGLDLDLFLRGRWNGERTTTIGTLSPMSRFDGGGSAQIDDLSLWMLFVNLTDGEHPAAAVDGGTFILPVRSFRMGLTWRFLD